LQNLRGSRGTKSRGTGSRGTGSRGRKINNIYIQKIVSWRDTQTHDWKLKNDRK